MHPFATLGKQANAGRLIGAGIKSLWNNGAWQTLGRAASRGVNRAGMVGRLSRAAVPMASAMNGGVGKALGVYGMAGLASPALGFQMPGSDLALNLGMPIIGAMNTSSNLITAGRAASKGGQEALKRDLEAGASQAAQDFISGIHIDPRVANNADAYRAFSGQIGHDMRAADTYARGGYKPMGGLSFAQTLFNDPNALIQNQVRQKIQQHLPGVMKQAGIGKIFGNTLKGLTVGGATLGLANSVFSKTPHDSQAIQSEGYAAAQAAIQNRLKNMSSMERMATRWDPTLAAHAVSQKFPHVMKQWESKYGPLRRGMLASTVNAFQNPSGARFYSTDAAGNQNFIN